MQQVQTGSENISSRRADCRREPGSGRAHEEQASSVEQTAASMEQITATVKTPLRIPEKQTACRQMPRWSKQR